MGRTACTEPQCLYKGALYFTVELYLYYPYGPYGLYKGALYLNPQIIYDRFSYLAVTNIKPPPPPIQFSFCQEILVLKFLYSSEFLRKLHLT